MIQEEKRFYGGGMDSESAIEYIDRTDWLSAFNVRVTGTDQQEMGYITSFEGTESIPYTLPAGINKCIGAKAFKNLRNAYLFIYNSNLNHLILEYNFDTNSLTKLFVNLTDSGAKSILSLDPKFYVEDINQIGDELYFLPSNRIPSKINPTKLKSGFFGVVQEQDLRVIKPKPTKLVTFEYFSDAGRSANLIDNQLIKFSNQYIFKDKQESVYSELTKIKVPVNGQSGAGSSGVNNSLLIHVDISDDRIETIVIGAKFNNDTQWKEVKRIDRAKAKLITNTTIDVGLDRIEAFDVSTNLYTFIFYNDGLYPAIDEQETDLEYDRVPKKANAQVELNGNILSYGGITEGFDPIEIDITTDVSYVKKLESTVPTSPNSLRLRATNPVVEESSGNFLAGRPRYAYYFEGNAATGDVIDIQTKHKDNGTIQTYNYTVPIAFNGNTLGALNNFAATQNFANGVNVFNEGGGVIRFVFSFNEKHRPLINEVRLNNTSATTFKSIKALKLNASRQYAIKYEYPNGRLGGVLTNDKLIAKTESFGVTKGASPIVTLNINHAPPKDAIGYYILSSGQLTHLTSLYMICKLIEPTLYAPVTVYSRGAFVIFSGDVYRALENATTGIAPNTDAAKWSHLGSLDDYVNATYLAFDVTSLKRFNDKNSSSILNYEFTEGDRANLCFYTDGSTDIYYTANPKDVAVSGFEYDLVSNDQKNPSTGFILKIQKADIDSAVLAGKDVMIEVYTPNRSISETNLFFAIGERYNITNGEHELKTIPISEGECFIKTREYLRPTNLASSRTYIVEDFNYSDFAQTAVTDLGRGFLFNKEEKEEYLKAHLRYSDVFNRNTGINKLNRFKAENIYGDNSGQTTNIHGAIQKMRQRSNSLIVWQEIEMGYIPVNVNIYEDANGQSNVIVSDKLLNNIRYNGNNIGIGTQTKAFAENDGDYYFVDPNKSEPFKADGGGVRSIAGKMSKYFREFIKGITKTNRNLVGIYNDFTDEYILSAELQSGVVVRVGLNSTDLTVDTYTATANQITVTQPANGTVVYNNTNGVATYTPNNNYIGADPFTFTFPTLPIPRNVCGGTTAGDSIPNSFYFLDKTNQPRNTATESNSILVDGINIRATISITTGEYQINNNGVWLTTASTVANGDSVKVRVTSSSGYLTTTSTTLTIGGVSDTFSVETEASMPITINYANNLDVTPHVSSGFYLTKNGTEVSRIDASQSGAISGIFVAGDVLQIFQFHYFNFRNPTDSTASLTVSDGISTIYSGLNNPAAANPAVTDIQNTPNITLVAGRTYTVTASTNSADATLSATSLTVDNNGFYGSAALKMEVLDTTTGLTMIFVNNEANSDLKTYGWNYKTNANPLTITLTSLISGNTVKVLSTGSGGLNDTRNVVFGTPQVITGVTKGSLAFELLVGGDIPLQDFDFLVLRYLWSAGSGTDLDTFTGFKNTGTIYDGNPASRVNWVGYNQNSGSRVIPIGSSTPYLNWGADNTGGSGVEAILLDLKKFITDFPSTPNPIEVRMNAVWFSAVATGNINVQVVTYKGGTMALDAPNYNFVNTGGTEVNNVTLPVNVILQSNSSLIANSKDVAVLSFNKTTNTATLALQ